MTWSIVSYLAGGVGLSLFVATELYARRPRSVTTFARLLSAVMARVWSRTIVVVAWMWLGWLAFAR